MARKSLGKAASAARKVISRTKSTSSTETPAEMGEAPAKKTAAKKTSAAKKSPTEKATAKRTSTAKKTAANATTATKKAATTATVAAKKSSSKSTTRKSTAKKAPVKKSGASAKKAAPSELVVKAGEDAWTTEELAEVLTELNQQRKHSLEVIGEHQTELDGLMRDTGDGAGHDQADVGASAYERDHELQVIGSERDKIAQIDRALARIDDGSYGQCESCGNPIGKMRLMAFPRATLCMTCKQREERR